MPGRSGRPYPIRPRALTIRLKSVPLFPCAASDTSPPEALTIKDEASSGSAASGIIESAGAQRVTQIMIAVSFPSSLILVSCLSL